MPRYRIFLSILIESPLLLTVVGDDSREGIVATQKQTLD